MREMIPYTELSAYVLNQLVTGTTFAVNEEDTTEQVFIPSQLAKMQNILPGDRVQVRAIPNRKEGGAKWFAVYVSPLAAEAPETVTNEVESWPDETEELVSEPAPSKTPKPDWEAKAREALRKLGGVATTSEIAEECDCGTQYISTYLRQLHERGAICRAALCTRPDQRKASYVFWGETLKDLMPYDTDAEE